MAPLTVASSPSALLRTVTGPSRSLRCHRSAFTGGVCFGNRPLGAHKDGNQASRGKALLPCCSAITPQQNQLPAVSTPLSKQADRSSTCHRSALFGASCAVLLLCSLACPHSAWANTAEKILEATRGRLADWMLTMLLAMLPIVEVRGAVPVAILALQMDPLQAFLFSVAGNMLPVPVLILGIEPLATWASTRSAFMKRVFDAVFARSRNQAASWKPRRFTMMITGGLKGALKLIIVSKEHEFTAIAAFVGVPLPGTGAWSGSIGCFVLGMPFWKSMLAIFIGVVIAAAIMTGLTLAGQWGFSFL